MKLSILYPTALLLSLGIATSAIAQIPNSSFNSFQRRDLDFFEQGRQQFDREIKIQIQPQPTPAEEILVIRNVVPMPQDFNPFVADYPRVSPNQTACINQEQVRINMPPNIADCK